MKREVCGVAKCKQFKLWLYIAVPGIALLAILGLSIGLCCMRRRTPPAKPLIAPAGKF